MKKLFLLACLIYSFPSFSQKNEPVQLIYLTDGSFLRGTMVDTVAGETVVIQLADGTRLELPARLLWQVRQSNEKELLLPDGRKVLEKGFYSSLSIHTLSAKRSSEWDESLRWGMGAHFSAGHQFDTKLKVGLGVGLDAHEYFFIPVFAEAGGFLTKRSLLKKAKVEWFGGQVKNFKRRLPICYNFQFGYNLSTGNIFNGKNDSEKIRGGWMFYPSIGFMVPSRTGNTFRLDFGYKFQRYKRVYDSTWWNDWKTTDKVLLKSFAIRGGWYF